MKFGKDLATRGPLRDLVILAGLISAVAAAGSTFPFLRMTPAKMGIGLGIFLLGASLHLWSKGVLARNFVITVKGPYRAVRHPYYLGNFFIDSGLCLLSGNLILLALYIPAYLVIYSRTIRGEEEYLTQMHGQAYAEYSRRVPRLWTWKLNRWFGPLDFSTQTLLQEKEINRLLRILAGPFYFLAAYLAFYASADMSGRIPALIGAIAGAVLFNVASILARKRAVSTFWGEFE